MRAKRPVANGNRGETTRCPIVVFPPSHSPLRKTDYIVISPPPPPEKMTISLNIAIPPPPQFSTGGKVAI